ncbi:MAG: gliding motility lipoprotein GldH [Marinilabiliaceae bacterium]|nr:gliding motility lipoprotein GldH [Marinilabiliaceae bacterium]
MTSNNYLLVSLFVIIMIFASCDNRNIIDEYVTIPQNGWNKDSIAIFNFDITNNQPSYNIYLNIRNTPEYPNANLWLFCDIVSPSGFAERDTVECILANTHGKWYGSGWGGTYHLKLPYKLNIKFKNAGLYKFRITQGMRTNVLKGIHNIGVRVEYSKE